MRFKVSSFIAIFSAFQTYAGTVDDSLLSELSKVPDGVKVPIIVVLDSGFPTERLSALTAGLPRARARAVVLDELRRYAADEGAGLFSALERLAAEGEVADVIYIWAAGCFSLAASGRAVARLAARADVRRITADRAWPGDRLLEGEAGTWRSPEPGVAWHVSKVNADDVWNEGYTGEGVLVCVVDTGVNYNHADLRDHMWDGGSEYPNHGWNFSGPGPGDADTMDYHGHGTGVAGVLASDGTAGTACGIAPDATVMVAKIQTESDAWEAWQFALEEGAEICNLSWGWTPDMEPNYAVWRRLADAALACGMLHFKSAGNLGTNYDWPAPWNVTCPAMVPPPRRHKGQTLVGGLSGLLAVGNTTRTDEIRPTSSRGPATWEGIIPYDDYPYDPEMGLLKPDYTAPGTDLTTCSHKDAYGYVTVTGTSVAAACAAGVAALLLSRNPELTPAELAAALDEGALDLGEPGFDNAYGVGRVDALESFNFFTPVELESFAGARAGTGALLVWELEGGSDCSFNLYRLAANEGGITGPSSFREPPVNSEPIRGRSPFKYVDNKAPAGALNYWLEVVCGRGEGVFYGPARVAAAGETGDVFFLSQNRPNPVSGTTVFEFGVPVGSSVVELAVFDLAGRRVATVFRGERSGRITLEWSARDSAGKPLAPGLYFYSLRYDEGVRTRKLVVK